MNVNFEIGVKWKKKNYVTQLSPTNIDLRNIFDYNQDRYEIYKGKEWCGPQ